MGRPDLAGLGAPKAGDERFGKLNPEMVSRAELEGANFCTISVTISLKHAQNLNQRQLWFLGMLQQGYRVRANDSVKTWDVSSRTAKYDISLLTKMGLVQFIGPPKTGKYEARFLEKTD